VRYQPPASKVLKVSLVKQQQKRQNQQHRMKRGLHR
jgi:hypothetical protein